MFENVLGQSASLQLKADIEAGLLAQTMLFQGPSASGKGTAALELGRVISCERGEGAKAAWNCPCPACSRHRLLVHPDLLCMGPKSFSSEIAASAGAFLRETASSTGVANTTRILFIRSIRKLLLRFNPLLWEDEPKGAKILPLANSLEETLDELSSEEGASSAKLVEGAVKEAYKLESEGMADNIPIGQLRRAAVWGRLAPLGRGKLLIIENADRMQDEARNSLLKLLEEPPPRFYCVLTSARPGSLIPTIVSRLRPYTFQSRDASTEREVIRRVFKDDSGVKGINAYLDSFLPVSGAVLEGLGALFTASVAYKAVLLAKKRGAPVPEAAVLLGKYSAPLAEGAGFGRPKGEAGELIPVIIDKAENFEIRSLFSHFLTCILDQVSRSSGAGSSEAGISESGGTEAGAFGPGNSGPPPSNLPGPLYNDLWKKQVNWAAAAALTYRLRPAQVLEKLYIDLSRGMAEQ